MKKFVFASTLLLAVAATTGCFTSGMNLETVANNAGLQNVTTGDANTDDYVATGHHATTELGFGLGIPFVVTLMELAPATGSEGLLELTAKDAAKNGANSMINVVPRKNFFTGFPFFFAGVYVSQNEGTGIRYE